MGGKLTPKEAIWYGEYIKDFNGTRASIAVGVSAASAHVYGSRMLRNAKVSAAIADWKERSCAKLELTAEHVLAKIAAVLRVDPKNFYDGEGKPIPVHLLDDVSRAAIVGMEDDIAETTSEGGAKTVTRSQRVKLADGLRAAELGGKYFKLFTDKFEASGPGGGPIEQDITVRFVRAQ